MITLDNVTYSYKKGLKEALTQVSAQVDKGINLLLGENGAGKTTLLHVMAGLLTPQSGVCTIDGEVMSQRAPRAMASVFFLPEDMQFGAKTINDFAKFHAPFYPTFDAAMLAENLKDFGLTGNEPLKSLSLGNRKKTNIAYALALQTSVLLLDEPANGLDIDSKKSLQTILARCVSEEQTVIISTHTVWDLQNLFEGVIVLHSSNLVLAMPMWQITERIAFVDDAVCPDNALYREQDVAGYHAIVENDGGVESNVNFKLLYTALRSESGAKILEKLNA